MTDNDKGRPGERGSSGSRSRRLLAVVVAFGGYRGERAGEAAGHRDDHGQHAADRERPADGSRDQEGLLRRSRGSRSTSGRCRAATTSCSPSQNSNGEIGYLGWVPMFIARTQGIPLTAVAASEVEGTSEADNWQNILVKGSSSIRTPADLAGKTVAVNALKGVGEVMIKAALKKRGVDPESVRLLALPFPAMRTALQNGQVDAIWTPEPFLTPGAQRRRPHRDGAGAGARTLLADRRLRGTRRAGRHGTPASPPSSATAINQSLAYAQANPNEIRDLLPAASRNVRLPIWSPLIDRDKLLQLAQYTKEFGVITTLPNMTQARPELDLGRQDAAGDGRRTVHPAAAGRQGGYAPEGGQVHVRRHRLVEDAELRARRARSEQADEPAGTGRTPGRSTLQKGTYTFSSSARPALKKSFRVT